MRNVLAPVMPSRASVRSGAIGLVLGCLLVSRRAVAEPEPGERRVRAMTLDQSLAHARAHHPAAAASRARIEAALREADAVSAQWLLRVGAFAQVVGSTVNNSTTTMISNPTVDIPRVGATRVDRTADMTPYASTAVAVGFRQELFDFGRIAAERAAASGLADVERQRATAVEIDTSFAVTQAFFAVQSARAVAQASRTAYERAVAHRDLARANVASGMRPPIELTRSEADVARYEAGTVRAEGALHVARSVFAASVGVADDELDAIGDPVTSPELPSLEDLAQRLAATPLAREAQARLDAQRSETRRLDAQTRPNVFATASVSSRAGGAPPSAGSVSVGEGFLPLAPNYHVGVVLAWSLIDPTFGRRAEASRARETSLGAEASFALRNQRAVLASAWRDAETSARSLDALARAEAAARANLDQAEQRFRVGLGTSTELADAQALRTEAEVQLAVARFQARRARASLDRIVQESR